MADGQVLRGKPDFPLFGKSGTLLYATPCSMSVSIVIAWSGGKDVDICGCYNVVGGSIGYNHGSKISQNGFVADWTSGDNTNGGPETVSLSYSGTRKSLADVCFDIHTNWFSVGKDADGNEIGGGGPANITATDAKGNSFSCEVNPATSKGRAATTGDPGVRINFNMNGTIKSITNC